MSRVDKPTTRCPKCSGDRYRTKSGWMRCAPCDTIRNSNYHTRNIAKHRERVANYYYNNKEKYLITDPVKRASRKEQMREYWDENKEKFKIKRKLWERKKHPDYGIWSGMKNRCNNRRSEDYIMYGGRGIKVCDRWLGKNGFKNFIEDMGPRPEPRNKYSLDRYPNKNGNYELGNCRWATREEQSRNKNTTIYVEYEGERIPLADAADRQGISYGKAVNKYKNEISENTLVNYDGSLHSLLEIRDKTGLNLLVLELRAKRMPSIEYLTAQIREVPTYEYQGNFYTIQEIFLMTRVPYDVLYNRIALQKMTVEEAVNTPVKV